MPVRLRCPRCGQTLSTKVENVVGRKGRCPKCKELFDIRIMPGMYTRSGLSREIRVFVSSTFHDMQAERDEMVKKVFPELRRLCRERGAEFVEVDLRWGITEAQSEQGEVLPICLAEIERCRPYFIGLLGERYGWVPDKIDSELVEIQPWLKEHLERSVTELEILHGVLNDPEMADSAFFYFRSPSFIKTLPAEQQVAFEENPAGEEIDRFGPEEARNKARKRREKLAALKVRIRKSGFRVMEDYADPRAVGRELLKNLTEVIDREYPPGSKTDPLDRDTADHEAFGESRARVYVGRKAYFDRLDNHVWSQDQPLVVLGESGCGKSALIANWIQRYREKNPRDFLLVHYIGGTADSSDHTRILRRIMGEIKRRYDLPEDIPTDNEKLTEAFPEWLVQATARGRLVLVLDALNQVEDRDNAPDLGWLPIYFPPNIRVIVSTLPGRSMRAIEKRDWAAFTVGPLTKKERRRVITEYLGIYLKSLNERRVKRIIRAEQSANPLYLRTFLNELRVFGKHEELDARIEHYLEAATVPDLFRKVLKRLETDYEQNRPGLVRDAFSLIWAARRGLAESELLEILGHGGSLLPRAIWSPLFLASEEAMVNRSGLLTFFHDYVRRAVEQRYLHKAEKQRSAHLALADYFQDRDPDTRKVDELPWQLQQAGEWDRLKACLADLDMFDKLTAGEEYYQLLAYWLSMGDRYDMVAVYRESLDKLEEGGISEKKLGNSMNSIAEFFRTAGLYEGAEPLSRRALEIRNKALGPEHPDTAMSLNNLGMLLEARGDYEGAEPLYRRSLEIREKALGPEHPDTATSLNNLAMLLYSQGEYEGAEPLYRRALKIYEKTFGPEHPDTAMSLNNLAGLLHSQGEYEGAEPLYRRALKIYEKTLGPEHPDTASILNNLGLLLHVQGDYGGAEPLYRRSLEIREKALGPEHPDTATSLNNLAALLYSQGDYEGAEPLYRRALETLEKGLGPDHPNTALGLNSLAALLHSQGEYEGAEPLYRRSLEIKEKGLGPDHPNTALGLNNLAELLRVQGDYEGAEPLYRRSLEIYEKALGPEHPDTASILNNLAQLLRVRGDYGGAEPLYRRSLEIREKALGPEHPDTAQGLNNLGLLLHVQGDYEGAEPLYRRALEIHEKALGSEHPTTVTIKKNLEELHDTMIEN